MRPSEDDAALLWDMLDAAKAVREFVSEKSLADYASDRLLRGGVERHIEIIGEAAGKVSPRFRDAHPEIPWRGMVAPRYVLAHNYGEVDNKLIWNVATVHIPGLIEALERLIPPA